MREKLLFVINPTAGSVSVKEFVDKANRWAKKLNYDMEVFKTTGKDDDSKIESLLNSKAFGRVIVAGGDGTISVVASKLLNKDIVLGIVAGGSANGLSTSLEFPTNLDKQFQIAFENKAMMIDTLWVNDTFCIHMADIGINAELIKNYEMSNSSGMLGYILQSIPTLFKTNYPYNFRIFSEGKDIERKGVLLAFANARKYGTGAQINPEGEINDGRFEVILYKNLRIREILNTFFKQASKNMTTVYKFSTRYVKAESRKPLSLQVDGEFIGKFDAFEASIESKSLKLAVPISYQR